MSQVRSILGGNKAKKGVGAAGCGGRGVTGEFPQRSSPLGLYVPNKNTCICTVTLINSGSLIQERK